MNRSTRNIIKILCNIVALALVQHVLRGHGQEVEAITTILAAIGIGAGAAAAGGAGAAAGAGIGAGVGAAAAGGIGAGVGAGIGAGVGGAALGAGAAGLGGGLAGGLGAAGGLAGSLAPALGGIGSIGGTAGGIIGGGVGTAGAGAAGIGGSVGAGIGAGVGGGITSGLGGGSSLLSSGLGLLGKALGGQGQGGGGGGGGSGAPTPAPAMLAQAGPSQSPYSQVPGTPAQQSGDGGTGFQGILSALSGNDQPDPSGAPGFLTKLILGPDAGKLSSSERSSALWDAGLSALGSGLRYAGQNRPGQRYPYQQTGGLNLFQAGHALTADAVQGQRQDRQDRLAELGLAWRLGQPQRALAQHHAFRMDDVNNPIPSHAQPRTPGQMNLGEGAPNGPGVYLKDPTTGMPTTRVSAIPYKPGTGRVPRKESNQDRAIRLTVEKLREDPINANLTPDELWQRAYDMTRAGGGGGVLGLQAP